MITSKIIENIIKRFISNRKGL